MKRTNTNTPATLVYNTLRTILWIKKNKQEKKRKNLRQKLKHIFV